MSEQRKKFNHPIHGAGIVDEDRAQGRHVLLHIDEPKKNRSRSFWVPRDELMEIPEVNSFKDIFEPDEAKYLNYISGALDLPEMSEYESKAHLLADIYGRICEKNSSMRIAKNSSRPPPPPPPPPGRNPTGRPGLKSKSANAVGTK